MDTRENCFIAVFHFFFIRDWVFGTLISATIQAYFFNTLIRSAVTNDSTCANAVQVGRSKRKRWAGSFGLQEIADARGDLPSCMIKLYVHLCIPPSNSVVQVCRKILLPKMRCDVDGQREWDVGWKFRWCKLPVIRAGPRRINGVMSVLLP